MPGPLPVESAPSAHPLLDTELLPEKINARTLRELCNASADDFARCEAIFADLAVHALGDSDEVKADQSS